MTEKAQEINELRNEVERLAGEIEVLRGVVEEGLHERRQGRDADQHEPSRHQPDRPLSPVVESTEPSIRRFIDDEEIDRISEDLDERRSERASNSSVPGDEVPNDGGESDAFPKISSERMERLFFAPRHNATLCRMCKGHRHSHNNGVCRNNHEAANGHQEDKNEGFDEGVESRPRPDRPCEISRGIGRTYTIEEILERMDKNGGTLRPGDIPPQTVLARVIGELEDEFAHFRE